MYNCFPQARLWFWRLIISISKSMIAETWVVYPCQDFFLNIDQPHSPLQRGVGLSSIGRHQSFVFAWYDVGWDCLVSRCIVASSNLWEVPWFYKGHWYAACTALTVGECLPIMTSSNEDIFRVTGPLWGEFTGHHWIPLTKACDAELWCFLWSAPEHTVE